MALRQKIEIVIVRPPLVYGPGAPGNFARLAKLVRSGLPLPFLGAANQRSIIGIDNLVDFIAQCIDAPRAAGECFVIADKNYVSIEYIVRSIAEGLQVSPRLFGAPQWLLRSVATMIGLGKDYEKLYGAFRLNCQKSYDFLDWSPPISTKSGIVSAAQANTGHFVDERETDTVSK